MNRLARMSFLLAACCCAPYCAAASEWVGYQSLARMNTSGNFVEFGVGSTPAQTCSYYSDQFRFDATTPNGKNMYALLLLVKETGQPLDIWYEDSAAPGTNQTNGCNESTMSVVDNVGISY